VEKQKKGIFEKLIRNGKKKKQYERFLLLVQMEALLYRVLLHSELYRRAEADRAGCTALFLLARQPSPLFLRVQDLSCLRTAQLQRHGLLDRTESTLERPCVSSHFHP